VNILWARHGHNQANVTRQFSHRTLDLSLTEGGLAEAGQLSEKLADRCRLGPAPLVVASPLRRAQQTAAMVASALGADFVTMEELRELNVGELDGRGDPAAWAAYEAVLRGWRSGRLEIRFPGGESLSELCARLQRGLTMVASRAVTGQAIVIAHGGNLRAALPTLANVADPGSDLETAELAELDVELLRTPLVRVIAWRA
jgi:broad specificity phosphatase PhoE